MAVVAVAAEVDVEEEAVVVAGAVEEVEETNIEQIAQQLPLPMENKLSFIHPSTFPVTYMENEARRQG